MKRSIITKIPAVVLLLCMLITIVLAVWFYNVYISEPVDNGNPEISAILYWIYILLFITFTTGFIFSLINSIRKWKDNSKTILRSIIDFLAWGLLLLITWLLGSGKPLPIIGYKGDENTYFWLKITDMWLYSIYILLGLGIIALFAGIIWSYFKKID